MLDHWALGNPLKSWDTELLLWEILGSIAYFERQVKKVPRP